MRKSLVLTYHSSLITILEACVFCVASGEEAGAAVNWATLRGVEGNCGLLPALRALNRDLDSLANAGCLSGGYRGEALILGLLARLAPLGFVLQSFIVKEDLLASRPDEILSAVNTLDRAIIEFRLRVAPLSVRTICDLSL
ncbi:MAG: hypothetical protein QOJ02_248 [Acidobacteriota bacterium]|jgi:hypothetical protein|nr:hypothetical protein [Acidobacteriota bacterium]